MRLAVPSRGLRRLTSGLLDPPRADEAADVAACEAARRVLLADDSPVLDVFEAMGQRNPPTPVRTETAAASAPPAKALALYRLVRRLQPDVVVEFGSALGVSGGYLAAALARNGRGRLRTVEGAPSRQQVARRTIESVAPGVTDYHRGLFDEVLEVLDGASLFFNDGNHWPDAVHRYAHEAARRMARPALLVVDDVRDYSAGMTAAFAALPRALGAQHAVVGQLGLLRLR